MRVASWRCQATRSAAISTAERPVLASLAFTTFSSRSKSCCTASASLWRMAATNRAAKAGWTGFSGGEAGILDDSAELERADAQEEHEAEDDGGGDDSLAALGGPDGVGHLIGGDGGAVAECGERGIVSRRRRRG